jgi:cytochrome c-type biogenesis protein CcmF
MLAGWAAGRIGWMSSLGLLMCFWIVASVATDFWERVRPSGGVHGGVFQRARMLPRAMVGMMVAHLGVAAFILGVTMVQSFQIERDLKMDVGDSAEIAGYTFTFRGVSNLVGPNYEGGQGLIEVSKNGRKIREMRPEKRVYRVQRNPMTEAAIAPGLTGDLYVSLGEPLEGNAWLVRVYVKPFIDWVWGGCLLMAFGGLLAVTDKRYRAKVRRESTAGVAQGAAA